MAGEGRWDGSERITSVQVHAYMNSMLGELPIHITRYFGMAFDFS